MPENRRVVGSIGSPQRPILISLSEVEGSRVVDIRRFYVDKESRELRPTQRGIAIQAANFAEVFACLSDAYGPITEWLQGSGASDQVKRQVRLSKRWHQAHDLGSRRRYGEALRSLRY